MTPALEARGLSKRYGSNWALRDCSLRIPGGCVVGLVGPNGAGKTTLLHLAIGLLEPAEGFIQSAGYSPRTHPREVLARVGFVAQSRPLYKNFTVEQHLHLGASLNQQWEDARARERLARYDIPLKRKVGRLSGGQQARVSLTLALAKCPRLLLLDEPLSNLDPLARQEFLQSMLVAATEDRFTVLFSSHVVAELGRFCDYIVVLAKGHVQLAGDVDALLAAHQRLTRAATEGTQPDHNLVVVSMEGGERQTSMIVQKEPNINLLGWEEHPVTLEELILAYMANPGVTLRSPALELETEDVRI
jgi:ABC-2 type transport system ATP-binding protein